MRGNRRAILVDILERNLDPTVAHSDLDKSGRMVNPTASVTEQVIEKPIFASTQKAQQKNEKAIEEKAVGEIVNDLKPADIIEEQDGFLIPSIAKKVANVSSVDEEVVNTEAIATSKKSKKKKTI